MYNFVESVATSVETAKNVATSTFDKGISIAGSAKGS